MLKYPTTTLDHLLNTWAGQIQSCDADSCNGVSIGETEETLFVDVPLPGVTKENIHLTYEKGSLLVKAEDESENKDVKYHIKASRKAVYRIALPTRVDEQASPEAHYKDGILKVIFQKSRSARPMKIEVKS